MHLGYGYDAANRRTSMTYPDGKTQGWSYDAAGRVSSIAPPGGGTPYTIGHDGAGNLTSISAPNGGTERWSYDAAGRLTGTDWLSGTTTLFSQTATLDRAGQRRVLHDSWGATTYGYDTAGRLTSASYPDGTTEQDGYDAAGNRLTITNTSAVSGTGVTRNGYDAADQLTTSAGPNGTTTYSYDGNGNQTGSSGPNGVTTNTFNDLKRLTGVTSPNTNESFVYDGQGDRLQSIEQAGPVPVVHNNAQDIVSGLSALASDGQTDYAYLQPGSGQAPLSGYNQGTARTTYLATDLLGSVRLATDNANTIIGAGAYDAWGNARPTMATTAGQTLLAGLRASVPFGYAGQQYDAGAGTYNMRARQYDPQQGRFLTQDPVAPNPQAPVTMDPYEYAGDQQSGITDPSGAHWLPATPGSVEYKAESAIEGDIGTNVLSRNNPYTTCGGGPQGYCETNAPAIFYGEHSNVSIPRLTSCAHPGGYRIANVVVTHGSDRAQLWDIENATNYNSARVAHGIAVLVNDANQSGGASVDNTRVFVGEGQSLDAGAQPSPTSTPTPGTGAPGESAPPPGVQTHKVEDSDGRVIQYWYSYSQPGLILWSQTGVDRCATFARGAACIFEAVSGSILNSLNTAAGGVDWVQQAITEDANGTRLVVNNSRAPLGTRIIGFIYFTAIDTPALLASNLILAPTKICLSNRTGPSGCTDALIMTAPVGVVAGPALRLATPFVRGGARAGLTYARTIGARLVSGTAKSGLVQGARSIADASGAVRARLGAALSRVQDVVCKGDTCFLCPKCFPAGTKVVMASGQSIAVEKLHAGDKVLSEDVKTGQVESEPVQALIVRPVSSLMAIDLSDGSTIKVQPNHPFWLEKSVRLDHPDWVEAGQLQSGDRLQTASKRDVTIIHVHWNVGRAVVYTLSVAKDHTFFVGSARVLVHNADSPCEVTLTGASSASAIESPQAIRFGQFEGGGEFEFLGNNSAGIEGYFTPIGSSERIPVSLKSLGGVRNMTNIIRRINENAGKIPAAARGKTVLYAEPTQYTTSQLKDFIEHGAIQRIPGEGVFRKLIFRCGDGNVVVDIHGTTIVP